MTAGDDYPSFPMIVHLSLERTEARYRVAVRRAGMAETVGAVAAERVAALAADVDRRLAPRPGVRLPGRDGERTAAEEAVAGLLAELIGEDPGIGRAFAHLVGMARGEGGSVVVAVDTRDPVARALPWELLAASPGRPPIEAAGEGIVVRLSAGAAVDLTSGVRGIRLWSPTPEDPACAEATRQMTRLAHELGLPLETGLRRGSEVTHVVAHGSHVADRLVVEADAALDGGSTAHLLADAVAASPLVVLELCDAGAGPSEIASLAGRVLDCGAGACLAPTRRWSTLAAAALNDGLYAALAVGKSLVESVREGRARVRALGRAEPSARWHVPALYVRSLEGVDRAVGRPGWRPPEWPIPGPEAAAVLAAARALAGRLGHGFVGVQHVLVALIRSADETPRVRRWRAILAARGDAVAAAGVAVEDLPVDSVSMAITPRMERMGERLRVGFDIPAMAAELETAWDAGVRALTGVSLDVPARDASHATAQSTDLPPPGDDSSRPATRLEVLGGPEDGRFLSLAAGDVLGRHDPEQARPHALYGARPVDWRLPRAWLRWEREGRATALRALARHRHGRVEHFEGAEFDVQDGDLLAGGRATLLIARG
jgi:hypothetical protein